MHANDPRKGYFLLADANALGGYLEEPFERFIPTLAPVSLPIVGGFTTARSDEFHLDHIVGCGSAHTLVSGKSHRADGSISVLLKAVIERLNILDVVTADRIVAQLSVTTLPDDKGTIISFAGTSFHGLRIAGFPCRVVTNSGPNSGPKGAENTAAATAGAAAAPNRDRAERFSIVERIELVDPDGGEFPCVIEDDGNTVEIPGFGRFYFGEGLASQDLLQFVAVRAELGCPVKGAVAAGTLATKSKKKGHPDPP
jgi:hypothetical protein